MWEAIDHLLSLIPGYRFLKREPWHGANPKAIFRKYLMLLSVFSVLLLTRFTDSI